MILYAASSSTVTNADGAIKKSLTNEIDGIYLFPNLSQDGNFITFLSNRSGSTQIWQIGLDWKNEQQLTYGESVGLYSKLLSDGRTLLFMMNFRGTGWILDKQTDGKIIPLTKTDTYFWSIPPDGKLIDVNLRDEKTKKYKVEMQNLENGEVLNRFDFSPATAKPWLIFRSKKRLANWFYNRLTAVRQKFSQIHADSALLDSIGQSTARN